MSLHNGCGTIHSDRSTVVNQRSYKMPYLQPALVFNFTPVTDIKNVTQTATSVAIGDGPNVSVASNSAQLVG
jgi:hypothetical protein